MRDDTLASTEDPAEEIPRLIERLLATERRLVELTAGEVDAVADRDGRTFLLQRAQEQLRHSEATKQAAILNALPAHIALLDAQGLIISVNEAWRRFGRSGGMASQRQGEGMDYLAICEGTRGAGTTDALQAAAGIRAVLAGTTPKFSLEYPCHTPTAQCWFLMMVAPLTADPLHGAVVMHVDITERKRVESSLQASEREQRQLAEQLEVEAARLTEAQMVANVGSWDTDLTTLSVRWSDETFRIFEANPASFIPTHQSFLALVHPHDRATVDQAFAQSLVHTDPCTLEHRLLLPQGVIKFVEERWRTYVDPHGKPVRVTGTCHDITARKKAENAVRASEKRFRALFDQAAVGVAQLDVVTGRYVQVNRRFCEMVGRDAGEMEQLTFAAITHPEDMAQSHEMARRLKEGIVREYTQEKRYVQEGRADVWANVTVSAMWAVGELPDFFIVVAQDITQSKQLEDQLRQAHKLEALGTLAGGIAHDFNNILAAIGGYTELARMKLPDNPGVREHLDAVILTVKRAADLVRQILTFSRDQPLERRLIQLQPVVAECERLLRATMPATIALDLEMADDAPKVLADETQVLQVLMNLGTNARQALGDRAGRIHIKLENCLVDEAHSTAQSQLSPGRYVRVSVSDTGGGMSAGTLRRIFEPFFTTKAPGTGTGLGLAVVHGIMHGHDGLITVDSQLGEGTVFHLYFPAHVTEAALVPPAEKGSQGRGQRVLLVDDEKMFIEILQMALGELGYVVEAVTQPAAALELVRAAPDRFAFVITDQSMPGMTGLQLAPLLRQIRPDLPIILMTGHSLTITIERVKEAGIAQLLLKPTTMNSLAAAVQAALSGQPLTTHVSNPPY